MFFAVANQAPVGVLRWLAVLSLLTIPAGFLIGLLRSRLARGALADLFLALRTMQGSELQAALARALGDPGLVVARRPDGLASSTWRRGGGPVPVEHEGRAIAVLAYDASLDDDPELVEAVTAATAIALENERLQGGARRRAWSGS